jgi:hypothetical protein
MLMTFEGVFILPGFLLGVFVITLGNGVATRLLADQHIHLPGTALAGCLLALAVLVPCAICVLAGVVLGWWAWIRLFAKRLALTKEEAYFLAVGPFPIPVVSRLCLRIAGVSKADEEQLLSARRKLG